MWALLVQQVQLDRQVQQVKLDLKVYKALLVQLGKPEQQVILGRLAQQEQLDQQVQIQL
jgi:hypothetical protein